MKKITAAIFVLLLVTLAFAAFDVRLKVQSYTFNPEEITRQVRIALITDLHSCAYGENMKNLTDVIEKQQPDIILLGGDICDDAIPNDNTESLLKEISDIYPCFYVTGNHEYWSRNTDTILKLFRTYHVKILNGSTELVEVNGQKLNICGISDPDINSYTGSDGEWERQLNAVAHVHENGYYTILLTHRPERIAAYLNYDFDLILSGHAHGGQWRIPGLLNGLLAPDQGLFPKYAGGEYTFDHITMIVSRGLAREFTPMPRIFNRPEVVIIDLL